MLICFPSYCVSNPFLARWNLWKPLAPRVSTLWKLPPNTNFSLWFMSLIQWNSPVCAERWKYWTYNFHQTSSIFLLHLGPKKFPRSCFCAQPEKQKFMSEKGAEEKVDCLRCIILSVSQPKNIPNNRIRLLSLMVGHWAIIGFDSLYLHHNQNNIDIWGA